jgi:hypothetical protein
MSQDFEAQRSQEPGQPSESNYLAPILFVVVVLGAIYFVSLYLLTTG